MKIPSRGSFDAQLANGEGLALWYNREIRLWTLQLLDAAGTQIGPVFNGEAAYHHRRDEAVAEAQELAASRGGFKTP